MSADAWGDLRELTSARIALGRAGGSLPTAAMLDFQLAHARARDAVHAVFDPDALTTEIVRLGCECLIVESAAAEAKTFLLRPDLGRRLSDESRKTLRAQAVNPAGKKGAKPDLIIIVSDGLSALAAQRQAPSLLTALLPLLNSEGMVLAPIVIASRGRVAIEDEIGEILGAQIALILIGERPGLGSPDSLGAYLVHNPRVGNTDANRNCVSNIRPEGLSPEAAARTLHYLLTQARRHQISGVGLKDNRRLLED